MADEILTGKNVNEAKKKVTDEKVNKLLKDAQKQLNKDINVELTSEERAEKEKAIKEAKEKAERKLREKEAKEREEKEAKEKAEKEAKEKAEKEAKEKAEREAREKAEKEAKEKAEREAREKAEKEAKEKAEKEAREKAEKEAKEKAEKEAREKAEKEAKEKAEKEAREKAEKEAKEKAEKEAAEKSNGEKIEKETEQELAATMEAEAPYMVSEPAQNIEKDRITIGTVIGTFLEIIWTAFKLVVVVSLVVGIGGFLLTRGYIVRGRCGDRQCLASMTESSAVTENKLTEKENVKEWLKEVTREKLNMEADDEKILVARKIVIDENSKRWVVLLHGFGGSMEDMYDVAMHYAKEGYNVLLPDLRANGESEGSMIGMGWLDRLDVINWIDVLLKDYPDAEIVIHGVDMGADTALMLAGEPVKSSIKAIVAEGAYDNAWNVVKEEYKVRHEDWPTFPILNMINPVLKVWGGYSLKEADAVKQVKQTDIPILYIQGDGDTYATADMTKALDQATASTHEVFTITNAIHGNCRYADSDAYYNKTFEFVGGYIN